MDVDDKTKIVLPVSQHSKDAAPDECVDDDATVFVDKNLINKSKNSNFSVGSEHSSSQSELVQKSQLESADVTTFSPSINPSAVFPSERPINKGNNDSFVIKNRFELGELLGAGGMGAVYKATDRRKLEASDKNPFVAIKVLNDDFRSHPDALISLQREARKSQTLAHPNIVNVYDFDRDGDMVFMTMEYLVGEPLDVLLRERSGVGFSSENALSILQDICDALIYAHSHNIIHSDFKPGNIFVTDKNGSKVFDFGISKAVKPSDSFVTSINDHTVFDAASLGALTPAYASLEMLQGKDPDPADDVYALACVAYELFAGRHPYSKTPADKALEKNLSPKRIRSLGRRQWRALERALNLPRENRTESVLVFTEEFFGKTRWGVWLGAAAIAGVSLVGAISAANYTATTIDENALKKEVQVELEQQLLADRIVEKREGLYRLLNLGVVSAAWEADVRRSLAEYTKLAPEDKKMQADVRQGVARNLIDAAAVSIDAGRLEETEGLLQRAGLWQANEQELSRLQASVAQRQQEQKDKILREKAIQQQQQQAREARRRKDIEQQQRRNREQRIATLMSAIEQQLRCGSSIDVPGELATSVGRLRDLDASLATRVEPNIAADLNQCATRLSQSSPQLAQSVLNHAKDLFPNQSMLTKTKIDFCNHLKAGSGARGERFTCQDELVDGDSGPKLVVVSSGKQRLAMGQAEVSVGEFDRYCSSSSACNLPSSAGGRGSIDKELPIYNVDASKIDAYLEWLSASSGYRYRLPSEAEWRQAARLDVGKENPDRNCHLRFGAIQKGGELVATNSGKVNRQGLKNLVGNVQELAVTEQGDLVALGGARTDPMSRCLATTRRGHSGSADEITGFRIVRDIRG